MKINNSITSCGAAAIPDSDFWGEEYSRFFLTRLFYFLLNFLCRVNSFLTIDNKHVEIVKF